VRLLAEYLRSLDAEQLPIATRYLTGKAFAQSDPRTLQLGWAVIFRATLAATKLHDSDLHRIAGSHGDAGKTCVRSARRQDVAGAIHAARIEAAVRQPAQGARAARKNGTAAGATRETLGA
jgi:hypothetical protein